MNENDRPVTVKDLKETESRLHSEFEDAESRLRGELKAMEGRLDEHTLKSLDALDTRLITAFHGCNERSERRFRRIALAEASTAGRIASLEGEDRFTALELRVLQLEQKIR